MAIVRHTLLTDLDAVMPIFDHAKRIMRKTGNTTQWVNGYPSREAISADINAGNSYIIEDNKKIIGIFTFVIGDDPNYAKIEGAWPDSKPYGTIHRIAAAPGAKGIADIALDYCKKAGVNIRIDTHADNAPMLGWIRKHAFEYCGIIHVEDGTPRKAFQLSLYPTSDLTIKEIKSDKKHYLPLLLIGDEQEDMVDRYLDQSRLFIGFMANTPVACAATKEEPSGTVEVKNLAVHHDFRRRGLGKRMLSHVESLYPCRTIMLGTGETPSTLKFYEKCGYTHSHRIPDFFTRNYKHPIVEEGVMLKDMVILSKQSKAL